MTARDHPAGASSEPIGGTLLVVAMPTLATRPTGTGPDRLRVLSLAGRAQADGLVVRLADYPIQRIVPSHTLPCQQTMQPFARDRRLPIEWSAALRVQSLPTEVLGLVHDPMLRDAALCTHGR